MCRSAPVMFVRGSGTVLHLAGVLTQHQQDHNTHYGLNAQMTCNNLPGLRYNATRSFQLGQGNHSHFLGNHSQEPNIEPGCGRLAVGGSADLSSFHFDVRKLSGKELSGAPF